MPGFIDNGLPALALFTGSEELNADTQLASGANPQSEKIALYKLVMAMQTLQNSLSKTMVSGTVYYSQFNIGLSYTPTPRGSAQSLNSYSITGVNIPVGATGGTDTWHVYVFNSSAALVARSATAGVTAGTALTIQQVPMYQTDGSTAGPVTLTSGSYYIGLQSNGTTANFKDINSPIWPLVTGSKTGSAGTFPTITLATTFTADLGPLASLY